MKVSGIIPARFASTRFPGKPLVSLAGKPLIQHVIERCLMCRDLDEVIVATDDDRIARAVKSLCRVEMTSAGHASGTDRIAEVVQRCGADMALNIQGDEPLIDPAVISRLVDALKKVGVSSSSAGQASCLPMVTAATTIKRAADLDNPNVVKVIVDNEGYALYFSRHAVPFMRSATALSAEERLGRFTYLKHQGIYGYWRETLMRFVQLPVGRLEAMESLEQLRAMENRIPIFVLPVTDESMGVDTPEDLKRVEQVLMNQHI